MNQNSYAAPVELTEVVALLADNPGSRILAGGQNVLVEPSRRHLPGILLVDLKKVPGLSGIEAKDQGIRIGAMTTIGAITVSEVVRKACPILAVAADLVGDAQVRNRGTLGGAIVESAPGSDLIPVLLVTDAVLEIAGPKLRQVPVNEFFAGGKPAALSPTEVITAITIPRPAPSTGAAYEKMKDWATLYALCGVAAAVTLSRGTSSSEGLVTACRVAVTGSTEHPVRLKEVEAGLVGLRPDNTSIANAASLVDPQLTYRGDAYASAEYRAHLTRVLTRRALQRAVSAAQQL